ncbi:MAG TPA: hypothetical protein VFB22_01675 [Candidatus Baltobacteraceae bacterium]|nr:hypothetical protein [Candidatus Baltobacteraceae bacterium]
MIDAARALWYAAGGVTLTSALVFGTVVHERVTAARAHAGALAQRVADDDRIVARSARVRAERAELLRELGARPRAGDSGAMVRFLSDAAANARAHRVTVEQIDPAPPRDPEPSALVATPLDVTLQGRYTDVLHTLSALSRGAVPARVELETLARKDSAPDDAMLEAALRVTLLTMPPNPRRAFAPAATTALRALPRPALPFRSEEPR